MRGEASRFVEVRLFTLGMGKRPIGLGAVPFLKDCGQSKLPGNGGIHGHGRADGPPGQIVLDADIGRNDIRLCPSLPVRSEIIGRPVGRWSEIPLPIPVFTGRTEKCLETSGFPKVFRPRGLFPGFRQNKPAGRRTDAEPDVRRGDDSKGARMLDIGPDLEGRVRRRRRRMRNKVQLHRGSVAAGS